jgi:hypothetical protein
MTSMPLGEPANEGNGKAAPSGLEPARERGVDEDRQDVDGDGDPEGRPNERGGAEPGPSRGDPARGGIPVAGPIFHVRC